MKSYGKTSFAYYTGFSGSLIPTTDKGYALAGSVSDSATNDDNALLVKFNYNGDTLWTKTYGGADFDILYGLNQTNDGGYALYGYTRSFGTGGDFYLIKTDSLGSKEWQKTYGGSGKDDPLSGDLTNDGGFIISGYSNSFGGNDYYVVKTDSVGNIEWQKNYGPNGGMYACFINHAMDGGYLIYSLKNNGDGFNEQGYIAKLNNNGVKIWERTFGGYNLDFFESAIELQDSSIILVGSSTNDSTGSLFGWIMKLTKNGDSLWSHTYNARNDRPNYFRDIELAPDGGFIICGSGHNNDQDFWLVKLDNKGCLEPGCDTLYPNGVMPLFVTEKPAISIYPNPAKGNATISCFIPYKTKQTEMTLSDMFGRTMKHYYLENGDNQIIFNTQQLSEGLYFLKMMIDNQNTITQKVVITK